MASAEQKRIWYPQIVTNHRDRGKKGFKPRCDVSKAVLARFPKTETDDWMLYVHPATAEAWEAYVFLMRRYKLVVPNAGGTHSCRNIGTTNWPSLHAYAVALDLPPNNYKPAKFQSAVLRIRTNSGKVVFKNLASINDRMHDEIDCSPADLAKGIDWTTVEGYSPDPTPPIPPPTPDPEPTQEDDLLPLEYGHGFSNPPTDSRVRGDQSGRIEDVRLLQELLNIAYGSKLSLNGLYDRATVKAVKNHLGSLTGSPPGQIGEWVGGRQYAALVAAAGAAQGSGGGNLSGAVVIRGTIARP